MFLNRITEESPNNPFTVTLHILAIGVGFGYGIYHIFFGNQLIGISAMLSAISCVFALKNLWQNTIQPAPYILFFLFQLIALTLTSYYFGIRGLIILFPITSAFFYFLSFHLAIFMSILFIAINLVAASFNLDPASIVRIAIALVSSLIFASSFSWIVMQQQDKLEFEANHDYLTKVYNRKGFSEWLNTELGLAKESNKEVALFFIDLDDFKAINDQYGHEIGDQLLVAFVKRVKSTLRTHELIVERGHIANFARLSGDEFALALSDKLSINGVTSIAERIFNALQSKFLIGEQEIILTSSIGIAFASNTNYHSNTLIKQADEAMYKSKNQGKNQFYIVTE